MNVIILAENHHNTLGLIRSIGECGHRIFLILKHQSIDFVSKSTYVSKVYYLHNINEICSIVKKISDENTRPVLIVSSEEYGEYVDSHYEELSKFCYTEGGEKNNTIQPFREKSIANQLALKVGFTLPRNWVINKKGDIPKDIVFPVLVKADKSVTGWKSVMKKCDTLEEFTTHLNSLSLDFFPLQVQEFITKEYEMLFLGCSLDRGKIIIAPIGHKKERHYPTIYGLGSYSASFETTKDKRVQELVNKAQAFLQEIKYTGLFSAEFIYAKGNYYFLEINLRNDATSILSTRCGCNLPAILCDYLSGNDWKQHLHKYQPRHYMHITADIHHVLHGKVSALIWLKELYKAGAYSYFDKKDWKPFVYYLWSKIKSKI